jgi:hypothetical protein
MKAGSLKRDICKRGVKGKRNAWSGRGMGRGGPCCVFLAPATLLPHTTTLETDHIFKGFSVVNYVKGCSVCW